MTSKGLDFPNIQHVIGYDMPTDIENYDKYNVVYCALHPTINGSWFVCMDVYLFDTMLATTCLIDTSKIRCHGILCCIFQIYNVWLLLKMLCSKVLVSLNFADQCCLPSSLTSIQWTN